MELKRWMNTLEQNFEQLQYLLQKVVLVHMLGCTRWMLMAYMAVYCCKTARGFVLLLLHCRNDRRLSTQVLTQH